MSMLDSSTLRKPAVDSPTQKARSSSPSPVHDEEPTDASDRPSASTDPVLENPSANKTKDSVSDNSDTLKCYLGWCSGRVFASKRALGAHQRGVHPDKRFFCTVGDCSVISQHGIPVRTDFRKHLERRHNMSSGDARRIAGAAVPVPSTYNR